MSGFLLTSLQKEAIKTRILTRARENNALGSLAHIPEVVRWSTVILKDHPEANSNITLCGAWLHDCGHLWPDPKIEDHAISGEQLARSILSDLGLEKNAITKIARIVRTHRNRPDDPPTKIEEIIVAAADSAAHFTDGCYQSMTSERAMAPRGKRKVTALGKLERDWRDIQLFPALAEEIKPLYETTKTSIESLPDDF